MESKAPLQAKTVLCVDDNSDTCELVTIMLGMAAFRVDVAQTVAEGCRMAQRNRYALILLDYRYPDGDGIDLCRCIRRFDRRTPILFYSAEVRKKIIEAAIEAGAQGYLVKPNDTEKLLESVVRYAGEFSGQASNYWSSESRSAPFLA